MFAARVFETPGLYDYIQGRAAKKIEIKRCKFLYPVHRYIVQQCAYQPLDVLHSTLMKELGRAILAANVYYKVPSHRMIHNHS